MSTYTQILYQIVFSTQNRRKVLDKKNRDSLYRFIWGILKEKKYVLYQINGIEDHIHIVTHVHPSVAVSNLVKDIKVSSSKFIKENNLFPQFISWQQGYGAFTYSIAAKKRLVDYVKNQEAHHANKTFKQEYMDFLKENNIDFTEKYLF